jgi:hypothetical protein
MATWLVVLSRSGPLYDLARPVEAQPGWVEHASFMDGLAVSGFILLGGPLEEGSRVVHAIDAESEEAVRHTLAQDPWSESHLHIETIDRWMIRLDGRRSY